jgi:hypothetical protein
MVFGLWRRAIQDPLSNSSYSGQPSGYLECYDSIEIDAPIKKFLKKKSSTVKMQSALFQQKDEDKYFFFTKGGKAGSDGDKGALEVVTMHSLNLDELSNSNKSLKSVITTREIRLEARSQFKQYLEKI